MSKTTKMDSVLEAATQLFSRHGVRRTSMDLIAQHARVAKPTLYAYFRNKEELYAGVCAYVGEQIVTDARAAAQTKRPLLQRVTGVVEAKFGRVYTLLETSPFAHELLHANQTTARKSIEAANVAFRAVLAQLLETSVRQRELDLRALGLSIPALTQQLMQVGHGAAYAATSPAEHHANLTALVKSLLRAGLQSSKPKRAPPRRPREPLPTRSARRK